jgi:DNA-directed RNA polymerase
MSSVYGAKWLGITEQLVALLDQAEGTVSLASLEYQRLVPCRYLSRLFGLAVGARMKGAIQLERWLRAVCRACAKRNVPMVWTTPAGLPIRLGKELSATSKVPTLLHGGRRWRTVHDAPTPGALSARETSRSVAANVIHSFDGALAWNVVNMAAEQDITVLPNHDCFGVAPYAASWLQATLRQEIGKLYRPDWLAEINAQMLGAATGLRWEAPPMVGTLDPERIGENPYLFS